MLTSIYLPTLSSHQGFLAGVGACSFYRVFEDVVDKLVK